MSVSIDDIKRHSLGHIKHELQPCPHIRAVAGGINLVRLLMDKNIPFMHDLNGDILVLNQFVRGL